MTQDEVRGMEGAEGADTMLPGGLPPFTMQEALKRAMIAYSDSAFLQARNDAINQVEMEKGAWNVGELTGDKSLWRATWKMGIASEGGFVW